MDQEKLTAMIKSLIEKDKENFVKKEGNMKTEEVKVYASRNEVNKKLQNKKLNINFDNNYLQEIPFENVEVETEKALLINTTLSGYIWVNKKHCYKSKKYQFKPVFLIKVFNEMTYNVETNGDPNQPASIKGADIRW